MYSQHQGKSRRSCQIQEKYAIAFFGYLSYINRKKYPEESIIFCEKTLKHNISIGEYTLPVPLKGISDLVYRKKNARIGVIDHKFVSKFSNEDEIDGAKLIQAIMCFFLTLAETGEEPEDITFNEYKYVANKDKTEPQLRSYKIVYKDYPMAFELFFRLYKDITKALLGEMVYLPNIKDMFDKDVALIAYIQGLDNVTEKDLKKNDVSNITELLTKKMQSKSKIKKYIKTIENKFISGSNLDYESMKVEDRIKMKLAEHGIVLEYVSKIVGNSVTLYQFDPAVGIKMNKIETYVKDVEQVVKKSNVRVLAPIPNSGYVGFEIPNEERTFITEKPENIAFQIALGKDVYGKTMYMDIREAPHMLVGGTTGSGKSVFVSNLIKQLSTIPNTKLYLVDPKIVELGEFESIAQSYTTEYITTLQVLRNLSEEMDERYKLLKQAKVKNISEYTGNMPYKFVIIEISRFCMRNIHE